MFIKGGLIFKPIHIFIPSSLNDRKIVRSLNTGTTLEVEMKEFGGS